MNIQEKCAKTYAELKNLKLVGERLSIPWQTVYVHLKSQGIPVTGDKSRYGTEKDKLARKMELRFGEVVPFAQDSNDKKFQSNIDFIIPADSGADISIDIKAASALKKPHVVGKKDAPKWGFCISKQKDKADFFVLYALLGEPAELKHVFVIPSEIAITKTTISIPVSLKSKWADYEVKEEELPPFFEQIAKIL